MNNREIAQQFLVALMNSDTQTMVEHLDSGVVWHPPTSVAAQFHQQVEGVSDVISFLTTNPARFYEPGTRRAEILHTVSECDLVSVHFNFHAIPKAGGKLCTCANWLFQLEQSKITTVWEVLDVAEWQRAVIRSAD